MLLFNLAFIYFWLKQFSFCSGFKGDVLSPAFSQCPHCAGRCNGVTSMQLFMLLRDRCYINTMHYNYLCFIEPTEILELQLSTSRENWTNSKFRLSNFLECRTRRRDPRSVKKVLPVLRVPKASLVSFNVKERIFGF